MTSGSEVMCRKKVDTPWSIYRVFTVPKKRLGLGLGLSWKVCDKLDIEKPLG